MNRWRPDERNLLASDQHRLAVISSVYGMLLDPPFCPAISGYQSGQVVAFRTPHRSSVNPDVGLVRGIFGGLDLHRRRTT